jgi:hypothetical protein
MKQRLGSQNDLWDASEPIYLCFIHVQSAAKKI